MKTREEAVAAAEADAITTNQGYYVSKHNGQWVHYRAKWFEDEQNTGGYERHKFDEGRMYIPGPVDKRRAAEERAKRMKVHPCPKAWM